MEGVPPLTGLTHLVLMEPSLVDPFSLAARVFAGNPPFTVRLIAKASVEARLAELQSQFPAHNAPLSLAQLCHLFAA